MLIKLNNIANGEEVFQFDCVIDSTRRPTEQVQSQQSTQTEDSTDTEIENESAEEKVEQDDGRVRDRWRLISAVEAWPTSDFWLPQLVDYSHNGGKVLKQAIPLIDQCKPDLMWNHSHDVKDVAGHIENAKWENSKDIPCGINADLVVDPEYDAKAAMGLQKGTLRNGSIGVSMQLKKSHDKMDYYDFIEKQGEVIDGEKVRWLPVKITAVRHMALVPAGAGADPNAGKRVSNSKTKGVNMIERLLELTTGVCKSLDFDVLLSAESVPQGLEEKIINKVEELKREKADLSEKYDAIISKVSLLGEGDPTEVLDAIPAKIELAAYGEVFVEYLRKDAIKWFDSAKVNPDEDMSESVKRMRSRIENSSDIEFLQDCIDEYREQAQTKLGKVSNATGKQDTVPTPPKIESKNPDIIKGVERVFSSK